MEPTKEKLEYESDSEDMEENKKDSRTNIMIKAVGEERQKTPAVVQGK